MRLSFAPTFGRFIALQCSPWAMLCLLACLCAVAGCSKGGPPQDEDPPTATPASPESPGSGEGPSTAEPPAEAESLGNPAPAAAAPQPAVDPEAAAKLEAQLAAFKVPPDWIASVTTTWDVAGMPWEKGRIEIRRLLGLNDEAARREAIKLMWDYLQKNDIGNGHEYGMYTFLGNEPLWAIIAFRKELNQAEHDYPPYFAIQSIASLYAQYGVYEEAEKTLLRGLDWAPPDAAWTEMRQAEMHDALGDLHVAWGRTDEAKRHYQEAVRLYPLAKPVYGKHLLPRRAEKVQSKLDLLTSASLEGAALKDGNYTEVALGYSADITLTVKVEGGRIADIGVDHQEKIDQNACKVIPQRIIEAQSLKVDGISGATVTYDAILGGTLRALRQAGLK